MEPGDRFGGRGFYWVSNADQTREFPLSGHEHHRLSLSFEQFSAFVEDANVDLQFSAESTVSQSTTSPIYESTHPLAGTRQKVRNITRRDTAFFGCCKNGGCKGMFARTFERSGDV